MEPNRSQFDPPEVPPCPEIPEALLAHLRAVFPLSPSRREETMWHYGSKAGEQRVFDHLLKNWREQQSKDSHANVLVSPKDS